MSVYYKFSTEFRKTMHKLQRRLLITIVITALCTPIVVVDYDQREQLTN